MANPFLDYRLEQSQAEIEALAAKIAKARNISLMRAYIIAVRMLGDVA